MNTNKLIDQLNDLMSRLRPTSAFWNERLLLRLTIKKLRQLDRSFPPNEPKSDSILGLPPRPGGISAPASGWKPSTYYLVLIAWKESNPLHYAILYTGLETSANDKRVFGNYSGIFNTGYDTNGDPNKAYYIMPVKEIFTEMV